MTGLMNGIESASQADVRQLKGKLSSFNNQYLEQTMPTAPNRR
jgi:hypothetical protein